MLYSKIIIVGVGGIGSNLFSDLVKQHDYEILLIDGDFVEKKNLKRQDFKKRDIGLSKSEILAHRANNDYARFNISFVDEYIPVVKKKAIDMFDSFITKGNTTSVSNGNDFSVFPSTLIIGCVDNHITRKALEYVFNNAKNIAYVDLANGESSADCFSAMKINGNLVKGSLLRSDIDPSVKKDKSNNPNIASCGNALDVGDTQTLLANNKAALLGLDVIVNRKMGVFRYE